MFRNSISSLLTEMPKFPADKFIRKKTKIAQLLHLSRQNTALRITSTYHLQEKCADAQVACPEGFNELVNGLLEPLGKKKATRKAENYRSVGLSSITGKELLAQESINWIPIF